MKFYKLFSLLEDYHFKIYKILGNGIRDYRSGLYFPEENIYVECEFGMHKSLFNHIITEKYPKSMQQVVIELFKKYYQRFLESLIAKRITKQQYFENNSYYQIFKDMGVIRYNIDRGVVSVSATVELIDEVLRVFSALEEQITIEELSVDLSKNEHNGDMYFHIFVDDDRTVPTTRNALYKLLKQPR